MLALPLLWRQRRKRLMSDGVDAKRAREVLGYATQDRPQGKLYWFHAASVGESLSILPLVKALRANDPALSVLITSGTPTSARLLAARMPGNCQHQFAPLDSPRCIDRFLAHWRPDALILVESEIWPNLLARTAATGVPTALVGARMSARSLRGWGKRATLFRFLTRNIRLFAAQNDKMAAALGALGIEAPRITISGNLKAFAEPLPVEAADLQALQPAFADRPVWVAASTHPGEEEIVLSAHQVVINAMPTAKLILVPRHPERAKNVLDLIGKYSFSSSQRSANATADTQVYLADTLGEMGLWYALGPVVFLGGSLLPIGGHNPFEVAQARAAILSGPHVSNFEETYDLFRAADACDIVHTADALAQRVIAYLQDPTALDSARSASFSVVEKQDDALSALKTMLRTALETPNG